MQDENRSKSTTDAEMMRPRRRRGRKPSNLSPDEKRRRRLERGRLAANKCRRKKRELENLLEQRAQDLMTERNLMLQENSDLRIEMQGLLQEVMIHSKAACGGIPEAAGLLTATPDFSMTRQYQQLSGFQQSMSETPLEDPDQLNDSYPPAPDPNYALEKFTVDPETPGGIMDALLGTDL